MTGSKFDESTFYTLMQAYRHALIEDQGAVNKAFNDVKDYIEGLVEGARADGYSRASSEAEQAIKDAFERGRFAELIEKK